MQVIGITGGVGAGKSAILEYLEETYRVKTLVADEIAHELMQPGTECYQRLLKFLPQDVYRDDETIDRKLLAEHLFGYERLRRRVNRIVHPAVKEVILQQIEELKSKGQLDYIIIEAALLIEEHYEEICDGMWYVYASEGTRRKRLKDTRGYSQEKIEQIFSCQLPENRYRENCTAVIDNDGSIENTVEQLEEIINNSKGDTIRMEQQLNGNPLVFGLDIGTRNIVGTVGYQDENEFIVVAQCVKEHETRSMLDGQIHDIRRVGRTIHGVKRLLEEQIHMPLEEVCIAAAGRVLKTVTTNVEHEFPEETVVEGEDVHTLDLLGVEKAQHILNEYNDTKFKFYCVGYSVVKYYLNGDVFSSLENHKADIISEDLIATFLPEDVVDGLYSAVEMAGLTVANMTLEPIAAINVAIPETFRMLNIALVDVGAGTSDICITKDGSIIAYGMIPSAGDELTELIVHHYLVDFKTAEHIKLSSTENENIDYRDIMMIKHTIPATEVWELLTPRIESLTKEIADKIKELNGNQTVSATFIVGGGGKIHGFAEQLAEELELPYERVALRGEEVLQEIHFEQPEIKKDPLLVTPIGICLNYYDQKNNFIFVRFNKERIKLYDNNKLTIVDAAMQAGFPNEQLFPRRGKEINFTVNGKKRIVRGEAGEAAQIRMNGKNANINTPLEPNCEITIEASTMGEAAIYLLEQLEEYGNDSLTFEVNGRMVICPKFVEVNGMLESPYYEIQENDEIEMRNFYTVEQLMEFMDVEVVMEYEILVNNRQAELDTLVYENFSVEWTTYDYDRSIIEAEIEIQTQSETVEDITQEDDIAQNAAEKENKEEFTEEKSMGQNAEIEQGTEIEKNTQTEQNTQVKQNIPTEQNTELEQSIQTKQNTQTGQNTELEQSIQTKQNTQTEQNTELEQSIQTKQNTQTEHNDELEQNVELEQSIPTEHNTQTEQNTELEQSIQTEHNTQTEQNTELEQSIQTEQNTELEQNTKLEQNAELEQNTKLEQNTGLEQSTETKQSTINEENIKLDQSTQTQQNAVTEQHTKTEELAEMEYAVETNTEVNSNDLDAENLNFENVDSKEPDTENMISIEADNEELNSKELDSKELEGSSEEPTQEELERKLMESRLAAEQDIRPTIQQTKIHSITKEVAIVLHVIVNEMPVVLKGKSSYIFVDVFDEIDFDLNSGNGRAIITRLNGEEPSYSGILKDGDVIEIYWREN
ncbi:MAG: dephospho-CoA kinase [Lachnospiraceae bacterium]